MSSKSFLGAASQVFGFTSRRPANDVVSLSAESLPLVPIQIAAQQNAVAVNPPAVPLPLFYGCTERILYGQRAIYEDDYWSTRMFITIKTCVDTVEDT
jgi:hypothetical protein